MSDLEQRLSSSRGCSISAAHHFWHGKHLCALLAKRSLQLGVRAGAGQGLGLWGLLSGGGSSSHACSRCWQGEPTPRWGRCCSRCWGLLHRRWCHLWLRLWRCYLGLCTAHAGSCRLLCSVGVQRCEGGGAARHAQTTALLTPRVKVTGTRGLACSHGQHSYLLAGCCAERWGPVDAPYGRASAGAVCLSAVPVLLAADLHMHVQ